MLLQQKARYWLRQPKSIKHQQGVALVVALFIVALVAAMAYVMVARLDRDTRRTQLILRDTQADFYVQGAVAWAKDTLRNNWEKQSKEKLIDPVPIRAPVREEDIYRISSVIEDMQARFNLNNLTDPASMNAFERLLHIVKPDISSEEAHMVVASVRDWTSPGMQQGSLNQYYLELAAPYRSAHRPMLSISELRLVRGVNPAIYQALKPYVTALPSKVSTNVQTASAPVLMTLGDSIKLDVAKAIVAARAKKPFLSKQDVTNLDIIKNHPIQNKDFVVVSQYFLLETTVSIEDQQMVIYTLLERLPKGKKADVRIVWQSRGVW